MTMHILGADEAEVAPASDTLTERERRLTRAVLDHHAKSFSLASRLLEPAVADDAAALYAWCRRVDDAVDVGDLPPARLRQRLEAERRALHDALLGIAGADPVVRAAASVLARRRIPSRYADELLVGMGMDIGHRPVERVGELLVYCHRAAGVVGLMMAHVLGVSDERALVAAGRLGVAMQLTNVCRDVAEDWARGRRYVPAELLDEDASAVHPRSGAPLPPSASWARAVRELLDLADRFYAEGDAGLRHLAGRSAFGIRAARLLYSEIGSVIRSHGCDPTRGRAVVSRGRKVELLARAALLTAVERSTMRWPGAVPIRQEFACSDIIELGTSRPLGTAPRGWRTAQTALTAALSAPGRAA